MPPLPRFSPGVIDYDGPMSATYQAGRALSADAARTWCAIVAPFVRAAPFPRILDLGSGTGRFARVFADSFNIQVVGVEPAKGMRAAAASAARPGNLAYVGGGAENIPLKDDSCGLAWLSCIWHHVRDRHACAHALRRVLHRDGRILVRGTFGDALDGFPTLFRYWPATRQVCAQLPTIQETIRVFQANGFVLADHRRVQQQTCGSLDEFAQRTRLRADSALALISDAEFHEGQATLDTDAARETAPTPVVELIEFLVFQAATTARMARDP